MLLTSITVYQPAQEELDADQNEYGTLGIKCRSQFGEAACEAGSPDFVENDPQTNAVDTIANILHYVADSRVAGAEEADIDRVLRLARMHFDAEQRGDDI